MRAPTKAWIVNTKRVGEIWHVLEGIEPHDFEGISKMILKWKSLSHVWLCDAMDYTVHVILQARILEWVALPFSRASSKPRDRTQVSHIVGGVFIS